MLRSLSYPIQDRKKNPHPTLSLLWFLESVAAGLPFQKTSCSPLKTRGFEETSKKEYLAKNGISLNSPDSSMPRIIVIRLFDRGSYRYSGNRTFTLLTFVV
jgi:hypothetical protein